MRGGGTLDSTSSVMPPGQCEPSSDSVDGAGAAGLQHGPGLGRRRPVQLGVTAEPALVRPVGPYEQRLAQEFGRASGDPGEGCRLAPGGGRQRRPEHRPGGRLPQRTGVTRMSMTPPQVSPTAKASSSL